MAAVDDASSRSAKASRRCAPDKELLPLADAAKSRSEADWLVGINGTRAMTAFNSKEGGFYLTTVGRVQTPTLAILVEREERIRAFTSRDYWEVHARFGAKAGEYPGRWFDAEFKKDDDAERKAERLWSADAAEAIVAACRGKTGIATEETKPSTQLSPLLYDLTSLQREANGRFGFPARMTLSLAQALYERHKVLTYPRTDSRALPEDYLGTVKKTLEELGDTRAFAPFAKQILKQGWVKPNKRIFDNSKISDHFAIIPTLQTPKQLNEAEQKLYDLVVRRFLAVFYPAAEYLQTTRITRVGEHQFKTEGKVLRDPGLARGLRPRRRRGEREPAADHAGREGAGARDRGAGEPDQAAAALHRGDAALGDGGRRQAGRGRRAARGHGGQGPRHAGDARRHHRGPDPRSSTCIARAASWCRRRRRSRSCSRCTCCTSSSSARPSSPASGSTSSS